MLRRSLATAMLAALAASGCSSGPDPDQAGRLGFMAGCWQSPDGMNRETWSAPQGGVMFGYATTMQGGQLAFFEQSRIDLRGASATYVAQPGGQRPTEFTERRNPAGGTSVAFENAQHDYPQRIVYRQNGRNGLAATISLLDGTRPTEYSWKRCD